MCALLYNDQKILIAQRPLHKNWGGKWEFPGGKVQSGESFKEALQRELEEELLLKNCQFTALGHIDSDDHKLHSFLCPLEQIYIPKEHRATAWTDLKRLPNYDLCSSDQEILRLFSGIIQSTLVEQNLSEQP